MVVFWSPVAKAGTTGKLSFGSAALPLQEDVKILGVEVDRGLRFDGHVKTIAKKASHRIHSEKGGWLDRKGRLLLYKAQVRPHLEYAALSLTSFTTTNVTP
ncbi:hypothetical protein E2C01_069630 [Portunus trituberculatus]|uniref:Uncharacterized protein n=1 Tax=Portunus trituberculatus TaxID=210409 RepID=A0A5B7HZE7_PORTR|nr:hypothetical protein [Portunus trituberculatus]